MCILANHAAKPVQTYRVTTGTEDPVSSLCTSGAFMYGKGEPSGSHTLLSGRSTDRQKASPTGMISTVTHAAGRLGMNMILLHKPVPSLGTTVAILLGGTSDHPSPKYSF